MYEIFYLILLDIFFVGILVLLMVPLGLYKHAAFAVLKRNFVGYFSNPTGYVFLCLFVILASFFAFCLPEFFTSNLANFDQLNRFLPLIMLVFIPAITMSIWAEERRQGTDELLLTLPADDFDIVIGKYLAAVSVFTVSLLYSQICGFSLLFLLTLGELDAGLLFTTYLGYWLIGVAMLGIGMVASFLTSNLTVGFILGAVFNAPLVLAYWAQQVVPYSSLSRFLAHWSVLGQFDELGRGVISLGSIVYFLSIAAVSIYVSLILVWNQRQGVKFHAAVILWLVFATNIVLAAVVAIVLMIIGLMMDKGESVVRQGHFLLRATCMLVIALCLNLVIENTFLNRVFRIDNTRGDVSSLHPETVKLIHNLDEDRPPVEIEAYIGDQIPPDYIKPRNELISWLNDFQAKSGGRVRVKINQGISPFSEKANEAEQRYDIKPRDIRTQHRGAIRDEQVILGAAIRCGLEQIVVPFFDYGIPVEYELIRSINTVSKGKRAKLGVVQTDANLMGGFSMAGGMMPHQMPVQPIIEELRKQYDVEAVNAAETILDEKFDRESAKYAVLLVVQPSSLAPEQLANLLEAIRNGQPTAIFEDPMPRMIRCPATSEDKPRPGGMFGRGGGPPPPKGDIKQLWNLLNIKVLGKDGASAGGFHGMGMGGPKFEPHIAFQRYNPYRKLQLTFFGPEWVFASPNAPGAEDPFNPREIISSGLDEVLFPAPGCFEVLDDDDEEIDVSYLVKTGSAGLIDFSKLQAMQGPMQQVLDFGNPSGQYTLAARIMSKSLADEEDSEDDEGDESEDGDDSDNGSSDEDEDKEFINVVYVADIDLLSSDFVRVRAAPDKEMNWKFENITFVLNILDVLAGEDEYVAIRKRKPEYSTLRAIEYSIEKAQDEELDAIEEFQKDFNDEKEKAEEQNKEEIKEFNDKIVQLQSKGGPEVIDELRDMTQKAGRTSAGGHEEPGGHRGFSRGKARPQY